MTTQPMLDWNPGDVILDLYQVLDDLGEGSFGKVYKVRHQGWNQDLAVKIPRPEIVAAAGGKENFEREAEDWVKLGLHPHTVSCYYVRRIDDYPAMFAEYMVGGSLRDWIYGVNGQSPKLYEEGEDVALLRILDIGIQLAWALHFSHEKGLVHQDVKPGNVMMTPQGTAKLTDFGLVKAAAVADVDVEATVGGTVLADCVGGSEPYFSPEQAEAFAQAQAGVLKRERVKLDYRSDMWGWAVVMLEMFQGECTWVSGSIADFCLEPYLIDGPRNPDAPPMPTDVLDVLRQCFQEDRQQRPEDMLAVAQQLQSVFKERLGSEYPREFAKINRYVADSLNNQAVSLLDLGREAEALKRWSEALEADPQHPNTVYNRSLLQWKTGKITDDEMVNTVGLVASFNTEAKYHLGLCHIARNDMLAAKQALQEIVSNKSTHGAAHKFLGISLLGLSSYQEAIYEFEAATKLLPNDQECLNLEERARSLSKKAKSPTTATTQLVYEQIDIPRYYVNAHVIGFDFDQEQVVILLNKKQFARVHLDQGLINEYILPDKLEEYSDFKYLGSNLILCYRKHEEKVTKGEIWDLSSGKEVSVVPLPPLPPYTGRNTDSYHFSAGNLYCLGRINDLMRAKQEVIICEPSRTQPIPLIVAGDSIECFAVCPKRKLIITGSDKGFIQLWTSTGHEIQTGARYTGKHNASVKSIQLMPDGKHVISSSRDKTIRVWELEGDKYSSHPTRFKCVQILKGHHDSVRKVNSDYQGHLIVSYSDDKTIRLWNWGTGTCLRTIEINENLEKSVQLSFIGNDRGVIAFDDTSCLKGWWLPDHYIDVPFELSLPKTSENILAAEKLMTSAFSEADQLEAEGKFSEACQALRRVQEQPEFERSSELLNRLENLVCYGKKVAVRACWNSHTIQSSYPFTAVAYAGKQNVLAATSGVLELWDWKNEEKLLRLAGHNKPIHTLIVSSQGKEALSCDEGGQLRLWDLIKGEAICILGYQDNISFHQIVVNTEWTRLISYEKDESAISLWDLELEELITTQHLTAPIVTIQIPSNVLKGTGILRDGSVIEINLSTAETSLLNKINSLDDLTSVIPGIQGEKYLTFSENSPIGFFGISESNKSFLAKTQAYLNGMFFDKDSKVILVSENKFQIWDIASQQLNDLFLGHNAEDEIICLHINEAGRFVFTGDYLGRLRCWEIDWILSFEQKSRRMK